jgi:TetR/AcrR family transcriptional regulator, transcriptional repressor for nem operon
MVGGGIVVAVGLADPTAVARAICAQASEEGRMGGQMPAPETTSALVGTFALARAVDDPKLASALREAALRHLTPDGA